MVGRTVAAFYWVQAVILVGWLRTAWAYSWRCSAGFGRMPKSLTVAAPPRVGDVLANIAYCPAYLDFAGETVELEGDDEYISWHQFVINFAFRSVNIGYIVILEDGLYFLFIVGRSVSVKYGALHCVKMGVFFYSNRCGVENLDCGDALALLFVLHLH